MMILGACFGLGSFALDTAFERIILKFDVSRGGGRGLGEMSQGPFCGQNR